LRRAAPPRHVQDGAALRGVDCLAAEHGVDSGADVRFLSQSQEELQRFVADAVFRVIEENARRLDDQTLAAAGILREELPQVQFSDLLMVILKSLPRRTIRQQLWTCGHVRVPSI
jgi:hypothetical protein